MQQSARIVAYRLVGLQALVVVVIALGWSIDSLSNIGSVLLGGAASVLPSLYFAQRLFATTSASAAKKILRTFYVGEMIKLALSSLLVLLILLFIPVAILPFVTGFVGAQLGFWLAPLLANKMNTLKEE